MEILGFIWRTQKMIFVIKLPTQKSAGFWDFKPSNYYYHKHHEKQYAFISGSPSHINNNKYMTIHFSNFVRLNHQLLIGQPMI